MPSASPRRPFIQKSTASSLMDLPGKCAWQMLASCNPQHPNHPVDGIRATLISNKCTPGNYFQSYSDPDKPCGKPPLNPAHNPMTKLGVNAPVGNWRFHPQGFSSFLSGSEQDQHRLIIRCTVDTASPAELYPQKSAAPYINIKNKLYKHSLFLFFISLNVSRMGKQVVR